MTNEFQTEIENMIADLGYTINNPEKLRRAVDGSQSNEPEARKGVGEKATAEAILAAYDKLGGLIKKGDLKLKVGSFYDFKNRRPRKEPAISFLTMVDGMEIEVTEEEAMAIGKAKEKISEVKGKKKVKKAKVNRVRNNNLEDDEEI